MSALNSFPSERQTLGYSDAFGMDVSPHVVILRTFPPYPWTARAAGLFGHRPIDAVETKLAYIRRDATESEKIAAWRELTK